ncbi:Hsp20 family protein [Inquilinus limosus]|uniref:Heat-shock protein n=1 Tax=Inquilinus limosus TaxID=171674 RepID=A0A211ZES0_9PROT|nr:Hsp20 family protein [Inquilinus limosus]OWJ63664.1 heat-shock protein [Inquilinus limosus]
MRTLDLSPLFRSTIGIDRMSRLLDSALQFDTAAPAYPPYNIEKTGEDSYRITMAVAGFGEDDLEVVTSENTLTVRAKATPDEEEKSRVFLHRGIAGRAFERRFQLADYIKVSGATLVNGLLNIELVREVPEAQKPRTVKIAVGQGEAPKQIAA